MAFIVEDGSGLSNANSYSTVEEADAYWADRGAPAAWTAADETAKQQALVKATQYLDSHRRFPWRGTKASATQRLQWPRTGAVELGGQAIAAGTVPPQLRDAAAALAALALAGTPLQPAIGPGGQVRRRKVGQIETEFFDGAPPETTVTEALDAVSGLLRRPGVQAPLPSFAQPETLEAFREGSYGHATETGGR